MATFFNLSVEKIDRLNGGVALLIKHRLQNGQISESLKYQI
jgi:hypothetical protein